MPNWLLINPTMASGYPSFPLGLSYISAALKSTGRTVHCLDMGLIKPGEHVRVIRECMTRNEIDIVGVGGFSKEFRAAKFALDACREVRPGVRTVVGGVLFSSAPATVLEMLGADYGVLGEGEETVVDLATTLEENGDVARVPGIYYRNRDGKIVSTGHRLPKVSIDDLPIPDYDGFNVEAYMDLFEANNIYADPPKERFRTIPFTFSRSCPYSCTFCFHSVRKFRVRSLDRAFAEIDELAKRYNINGIAVIDDLVADDKDRLVELCKWMRERDYYWASQFRVDCVTPEVLKLMKSGGRTNAVGYGFESMSERILKSMRKNITPKQIAEACRLTYDARLRVVANFIFGDAAETVDTANETLNWWLKHRKYGIELFPVNIFPGTKLLDIARSRGVDIDLKNLISSGESVWNTTFMNNHDYHTLVAMIGVFQTTLHIPGNVRQIQIGQSITTVSGSVRCPHCGEVVRIPKISLQNPFVYCKLCNGPFHVPAILSIGRRYVLPQACTDLMLQAKEAYDQRNFADADCLCDQALGINPADYDAYFMKGNIALKTKDYATAKMMYIKALSACPDLPWAHNNLGVTLYAQGYIGWASVHFGQAALLDRSGEGHANQEKALALLGDGDIPLLPTEVPQQESITDLAVAEPVIRLDGFPVSEWLPLRTDTISPLVRSGLS